MTSVLWTWRIRSCDCAVAQDLILQSYGETDASARWLLLSYHTDHFTYVIHYECILAQFNLLMGRSYETAPSWHVPTGTFMWVGVNTIFLSCCTRSVYGVRLGQSNCFVSNLIYLLSSMLLRFLVKLLPRTTPAFLFNHGIRRPLPLLRIQTFDSTGILERCFISDADADTLARAKISIFLFTP